jgi:hypothetical protein
VKSLLVQLKLVGMLLLMMGGMLSVGNSVRAAEPSKDYWFTETLTVSDVDLPEGVTIRSFDTAASPRGLLILENETDTLLFVLSLGYKGVLVMKTPDPNWKARVNGAHEVASYLVAPNRPAYLNMEALTDLDRDLEDRNVLTSDPPAENVPSPTAQDSELLLVYDGQVIEVPFTVTYALNTNFDNGLETYQQRTAAAQATNNASATSTQQAEASATWEANKNIMLMGLLGAAGLSVIIWLVWRGVAHRKDSFRV